MELCVRFFFMEFEHKKLGINKKKLLRDYLINNF